MTLNRLLPFAALAVAWCLVCAPAQAKMAMCAGKNALWEKFLEASGRNLSDALPSPDFAMESEGYGYETAMGRACWPSPDPIGEQGGVNLYGMEGNDAVNLFDLLGLLELALDSPYQDTKPDDPKTPGNDNNQDIWNQLWTDSKSGKSRAPDRWHHAPFLTNDREPNDRIKGATFQAAYLSLSKHTDAQHPRCYYIDGKITHIIQSLNMNPTAGSAYWDYLGHELQHIRSFINRLKSIIDKWKPKQDRWYSEKDADKKMQELKDLIEQEIKDTQEKESSHDPSGGFGTPGPHDKVPFGPHK